MSQRSVAHHFSDSMPMGSPGEAGSANGDERGAFFGAAAGQLWRVPLDLTDRGFRAIWRGGWFSQAIGAALSSG